MLSAGSWAFLLFYRHKFHPAFRTISGMIGYDLGMHQAGVLLSLLTLLRLIMIVLLLDLVLAM